MSTAAAPEMKRTIALLHVLRNAKLIDYVGLALVGLVILWVLVNFVKEPVNFINVAFIGLANFLFRLTACDGCRLQCSGRPVFPGWRLRLRHPIASL